MPVGKTIIVLGGGIKDDGSLPEEAKKRVEKGVELFKEGDSLIMSGKWSFLEEKTFSTTEAQAMKAYALILGISEKNIFLEEQSQDTLGNAYFCKRIVEKQGWDCLIVVTSKFHEKRASFIFERAFGKKIEFATTPSLEREKEEQVLLKFTKDKLEKRTFPSLIEEDHPAYAKNPKFSKKEFLSILN